MKFSHLHVHTQFSLLDGQASISNLYNKAIQDEMPAMAITDHGNMFGVFSFVAEAWKHKKEDGSPIVKPIIGCEFYVVEDRHKKQFTKENKDIRFHQLLLAKNKEGYQNLSKLCSLGYIEGLYSKWPRVDKELILKYHQGLIATTCCLGAMVPRTILRKGVEAGEQEFKWWLDLFGEDYYIELQRHDIPEQDQVNAVLLEWADKYQVPVICTNDSHYVNQNDANAHDILLCVNTGEIQSTPIHSEEDSNSRDSRFGFPNDQFYFKTTREMESLFHDVPQALDYTNHLIDKVEAIHLNRDILVPNFPIPPGFADADDYLRHLTYQGAQKRYESLTPEIEERLNFELHVIKTMGFPGYFLIVADFVQAGRDMGVYIGPGRGSAAGSAVAYCVGITNVDPIKYGMLFERFLNPERKTMPDIDTDFDDEGREKVLQYVIEKYGKNQVAQLINYGTMKAKSAIKDVSRVLNLPLNEATELAKLVPEKAESLQSILLPTEEELKHIDGIQGNDFEKVIQIRKLYQGNDLKAKVLKEALSLEGSVRNTGIHASAVIIAPGDLLEYVPVTINPKEGNNMLVTQWEGKVIEHAGLLKMDFLGLKTLTIIRNSLEMVHEKHGIKMHLDDIPLEDPKALEIFQRGDTSGIFQFESDGMKKHLRELKPTGIEDLTAMCALFRPGPMAYIAKYIRRKHGLEPIEYDLEVCREILEETYGITVYQEQVMRLSQRLAGFSKGDADNLRKAMGKKNINDLSVMYPKFLEQGVELGNPKEILEKIWKDWEAFASYAFNKSHATCYAIVASQTAYLKANYPEIFMASILNNSGNIEDIAFFMNECKRMGIPVLGPDINESQVRFSVNDNREIRFGLGSIKGAGEAAITQILEERQANGHFTSLFDVCRRVNLRHVNRRVLEALAYGGAFDTFEDSNRARYFTPMAGESETPLDKALKYGNTAQAQIAANQGSLFGGEKATALPEPKLPQAEPWGIIEQLNKEKEVLGIYMTGHPLDNCMFELNYFCQHKISDLENLENLKGKEVTLGGMISSVQHKTSKNGHKFGVITLEDFTGKHEFLFFRNDYIEFNKFMIPGLFLFVRGYVGTRFNTTELELKVKQLSDLTLIKKQLLKGIQIKIDSTTFNDSHSRWMTELIKTNPGDFLIKFLLQDETQGWSIPVLSNRYRMELDQQVVEELRRMDIEFQMQFKTAAH